MDLGAEGEPDPEAEPEDQAEAELASEDGRHARRDRNRLAVLDATLELFHEGIVQPRLDDVAERADVSLRSIYRYFPDLGALYQAAMDRNIERAWPTAVIPGHGEGPLADRIDRCVAARMAFYAAMAPTVRVARAAAAQNELIRARYAAGRELLRQQLEWHFAPELSKLPPADRAATATVLDVLCQLETLHYLRVDRQLSAQETAQAISTGLTIVLTALAESCG